MGVKLSDLLAETMPATFTAGGATVGLEVRVFPQDLAAEELERIKQPETPMREFYLTILPLNLAGWDLEEKGHAIPVTAKAIGEARIPTSVLKIVYEAMIAARAAGKDSAGTSSEPSTPTAV